MKLSKADRLRVKAARKLSKLLPYGSWSDYFHMYANFLQTHGRRPGNNPHFNDRLFSFLAGDEIDNPLVGTSADKWLSKLLVHGLVGRPLSVPTIAVFTTPEEIDAYEFPERCAIKATHSAGDSILLRPGETPDRNRIKSWLTHNFYHVNRERSYRNLTPRVVVEPILFEGEHVHDYKIFCSGGKAKALLFVQDRNVSYARAILDMDFQPTDIKITPSVETLPNVPRCWAEVVELTEQIASLFTYVRIDWYIQDESFYLGEISHGHMCGLEVFPDEQSEIRLGEMVFGPVDEQRHSL